MNESRYFVFEVDQRSWRNGILQAEIQGSLAETEPRGGMGYR